MPGEFTMRRTFLVATAVIGLTAAAHAQFEGTIRMRTVTYQDADSSVILPTVWFKGPLFAAVIEAPPGEAAGAGRFILRGDKRVMWIIADRERKFIEMQAPKPPAPLDSATAGKHRAYTLTKTGQAKAILGYQCEEWVADEGGGVTSRVWATAELGGSYEGVVQWFDGMSLENAGDQGRWEREIAGMKLFPLLVLRSEEGGVVEREEVLSVEPGRVPDGTFDEPDGYEKQTIDPDFEKMFERMMEEMEKRDAVDSTRDDGGDGGY
jgi:hypothetical protein